MKAMPSDLRPQRSMQIFATLHPKDVRDFARKANKLNHFVGSIDCPLNGLELGG